MKAVTAAAMGGSRESNRSFKEGTVAVVRPESPVVTALKCENGGIVKGRFTQLLFPPTSEKRQLGTAEMK